MRLGDVATFINGYAFKPSDYSEHGLPIIRIQDLTGNSYQTNMFDGNLDYKYLVRNGDILVSWSASIDAYVWQGSDAWLNQHIFKVVFDKVEVSKSFFFHQMRFILKESGRYAHGATMRHLTKKTFDAFEFLLPSAEVQLQQTTVIDSVDRLIRKACNCLQLLDNLVKSRFVEMFGTIDETPFEVVAIQDLCEPIKDGTHQTPKYANGPEDGVAFLSSKDVVTGRINWSNIKYITPELHEELHRRIAPRRNDVLLAKNGTTGVCAIVDSDRVFDLYVTLALLRPLDGVNSVYLWAAVNSDRTKVQFNKRLKGVGVPNLHLKEIKQTMVVRPPTGLQQEFAAFVQQVDKSKFAVQQAIEQLELLKAKLMQEYFG